MKKCNNCLEYYHGECQTCNAGSPSLLIDDMVICPFCKQEDFDLVGLKSHLDHGDCEKWNETIDLNRMF